MAGSVQVARVEEVPAGAVKLVDVEDHHVALVNVDGHFYAVDNKCPHRGGWLGEGELNLDWGEWALECPLHGSVFDVRTGEVLNPPATDGIRTYRVEVEGGGIQISVD
jgi:3-phenylpropionate/trans-cinnamate dioxygenase ferredoxin subunit